MANANTALPIRQVFYRNNPLPYARWTVGPEEEGRRRRIPEGAAVNPNHPLLLNADEIMPNGYDVEDLEEDITHCQNFWKGRNLRY